MHGVAALELKDAREAGEREEHELAHETDDDTRGLVEALLELREVNLRSLELKRKEGRRQFFQTT